MTKKIFVLFFIFFLIGCSDRTQVIRKANGESKTYSFFKDFNINHYYVSFWDRNTSINDDTKIIMARNNDKYYYELDGYERNIIIQKDGVRYNVSPDKLEYYKEEKPLEDFSKGILPTDIKDLKKKGYRTGKEKIYNSTYVFEKYEYENGETTYFYKGDKLIYIRYKSIQNQIFLRFNEIKKKFDDNIFEISDDFEEITY